MAASLAVGGVIFVNAGALGAAPAAAAPSSVHVAAVAPAEPTDPAAQDEQADVAPVVSHVEINRMQIPRVFGQLLIVGATVTLDGPANLSGQTLSYVLNGESIVGGPLLYVGNGKFMTLIPMTTSVGAGVHQLQVQFPGVPASQDFAPVAPSESEVLHFDVSQAESRAEILTSPTEVTAFHEAIVTARVSSDSNQPVTGKVVLRGDGVPLATAAAGGSMHVNFVVSQVPWGTEQLTVAYEDPAGNIASSVSAPAPITVKPYATSGELTLSASRSRAIDPVEASIVVRSAEDGATVDPRGGVEVFVDGESVYAETSSDDVNAVPGDGTTEFRVNLTGLEAGAHRVTARYLPAPGFAEAPSMNAELYVDAVPTNITATSEKVQGTPKHPAVVDVEVVFVEGGPERSEAGSSRTQALGVPKSGAPLPNGTVQPYLNGAPFGSTSTVVDGAGVVSLAGLPVGAHKVELRFVADQPGVLPSDAEVIATVIADGGDGGIDPTKPVKPDTAVPAEPQSPKTPQKGGSLAATGAESMDLVLVGGSVLTLVAAGALVRARIRRRQA